jgi:UDP-GlcNAc:undecaprenyl-phosphate GlcNAc-1-phosphate transferase
VAAVAIFVAAALSWITCRIAMVIGPRLGLVDLPDGELKTHRGAPVPLGGGGVLIGSIVGLAVAGSLNWGLLLSILLIWSVGLVDDLRGLNPWIRLTGVTISGVVFASLSEQVPDLPQGVFWVVAVVVVVNSINLFDGLDGLAGSVGTIAVVGLSVFGAVQGGSDWWMPLVVGAALIGFLRWNWPRARVFLGDNGAYVLGLLLVWAAMWSRTDRMAGVVAVALIGVPLIDLGVTIFRRGLSGSPIFSGDRDHSYDRLYEANYSEAWIALVFSLLQAVWMVTIIGISALFGDLPAAITALSLGAGAAGLLGVRMAVKRP